MGTFQSVLGYSNEQSTAHYSSPSTVSQLNGISCTISNWFENQRPQRTQISAVTNAPFPVQNSTPMASRLIAIASFPSAFFQLLQYSRENPSFSADWAALMAKTYLTYPAYSVTFVDFAVQFFLRYKFSFYEERRLSQVRQWRDFPKPITILC